MPRIQYSLDFVIKSSPAILFNFLSTPSGLAQWFADNVDRNEDTYSFFWDGYEETAELLEMTENESIKFQMEDADDDEFLEFKIQKSEVTRDTILIITDFADDFEVEDQKKLWTAQVDALVSRVGGRN